MGPVYPLWTLSRLAGVPSGSDLPNAVTVFAVASIPFGLGDVVLQQVMPTPSRPQGSLAPERLVAE